MSVFFCFFFRYLKITFQNFLVVSESKGFYIKENGEKNYIYKNKMQLFLFSSYEKCKALILGLWKFYIYMHTGIDIYIYICKLHTH